MTDDDVGRCLLKFPLLPRDTYYSPRRYYYRPTISYIIQVGSIRSLTTVLPKNLISCVFIFVLCANNATRWSINGRCS